MKIREEDGLFVVNFPRSVLGKAANAKHAEMLNWCVDHTTSGMAFRLARDPVDGTKTWEVTFGKYTDAFHFMLRWSDDG